MATYTGNAANNPPSITIVSDGTKPTAATVNPGLEGLMDKAAHILDGTTAFTAAKSFSGAITLSVAGDDVSALEVTAAPTERKLLLAANVASSRKVRVYARDGNATTTRGLDITVNAQWMAAGTEWEADADTFNATIVQLFAGTASPDFDGDRAPLRIQNKESTGTNWTETGWDADSISICPGTPTATDVIKKHTIVTKLTARAWGRYTTDGAGGITIAAGCGLVSAAISGNNARFTLRNTMVTGYAVQATSTTAAARVCEGRENSTTVVEVRLFTNADLTVEFNQGGFLSSGTFVVYGEQA